MTVLIALLAGLGTLFFVALAVRIVPLALGKGLRDFWRNL